MAGGLASQVAVLPSAVAGNADSSMAACQTPSCILNPNETTIRANISIIRDLSKGGGMAPDRQEENSEEVGSSNNEHEHSVCRHIFIA